MTIDLQEKKKKRFLFLQMLYEVTGGDYAKIVQWREIGDELGFSPEETDLIRAYLIHEGLAKMMTFPGLMITHQGVREIERALDQPDQPTTYFPPVNVIYVERMDNSQIQQGTQQSNQGYTYSNNDLERIRGFATSFREKLPDLELTEEQEAEATADLGVIEAQLQSPKPKTAILGEALKSLLRILEGAAGNVAAAFLIQAMRGGS